MARFRSQFKLWAPKTPRSTVDAQISPAKTISFFRSNSGDDGIDASPHATHPPKFKSTITSGASSFSSAPKKTKGRGFRKVANADRQIVAAHDFDSLGSCNTQLRPQGDYIELHRKRHGIKTIRDVFIQPDVADSSLVISFIFRIFFTFTISLEMDIPYSR
ncbi:hypothetical protein K2173_001658 [Erythroxylum novogranatense]|uniref:Uncharacterized protein n=1 Tax=Erythroxylum novogranatense TaxID=1862640 RepID=A0AAV8T5L7_9ROSI|nr:hypothetical protein K2173_001658 [Erythroxylum novogranatense]